MNARIVVVAGLGLVVVGCDRGPTATACGKDADCKGDRICVGGACVTPGGKEQSAAVPGQVAPAPGAKGAVTSPEQQSYSEASIRAIPEACSNAHVMLASAPTSVGADYGWPWSKQAMLVNLQYKVVTGRPSAHGEVSFSVHQADKSFNNAWLLVADCADGGTCNHLAAMYKAVVKSSSPQVICGALPASFGRAVRSLDLLPGGPQANLPSDVIGKCARLAACVIASDSSTTADVGIDCQKAPHTFKLDCATRYPCASVLSCMGR